jgi:hypothetical protein
LLDPADAAGELGFEPCWQLEERANQSLELGYPCFQGALCSGAGGCLGFNSLQPGETTTASNGLEAC